MTTATRHFPATPARSDAVLLSLHATAWAVVAVGGGFAAAVPAACAAFASVLVLCKLLTWPPRTRTIAALVPLLVAAAAVGLVSNHDAAVAGATTSALAAIAAAMGYGLFTWARRVWLELSFRGADGRPDGFDYGRWRTWIERRRARGRRGLRILFPRTDKEASLRAAEWTEADRLAFAAPDADVLRDHDLVVPLSTHDLAVLEPWRALLAQQPIALPSAEAVALCHDKPRFNRALVEHGFGAHVPAMTGPFAFPYILKKRSAEWGEHCHVVACADDERRLAAELADPAHFRQAYVPGRTEFTTHVLVRGGRVVHSLTLEFTFDRDHPVKSRDCAAVRIRMHRCRHRRLFASIVDAIGFEGLGCFNYKLVAGQPLIFEFNPRFGASLAPYFPWFLRGLPPARRP